MNKFFKAKTECKKYIFKAKYIIDAEVNFFDNNVIDFYISKKGFPNKLFLFSMEKENITKTSIKNTCFKNIDDMLEKQIEQFIQVYEDFKF